MKKCILLSLLSVFVVMGCELPAKSSSTRSLSKTPVGSSFAQQAPAAETTANHKEPSPKTPDKEPEVTVRPPLSPLDLQDGVYFGIRTLKDGEDDEEQYADRRLTIKFSVPRGGTDLKADFGDEDTEVESKKAKTKQNLDVQINGMFITLLDKGQEFLKLEVSKDFKFMFITEDKIQNKPVPNINYKDTGLVLNGREWHGNTAGYNGPILPQLPKYPFEN